MRGQYESTSGFFTRRLAAALVGVWLGVSCLFCCGDVPGASAARVLDADSAAQASAPEHDCCRARLQQNEKGTAHDAESVPRDNSVPPALARVRLVTTGGGVPCLRCSRQVANTARRSRVPPAPSPAPNPERARVSSPLFTSGAARVGASLVLNRSGTHLRLCVFLI